MYNILVTEGGLERKEVVFETGNKNGPRSFVFASPGFQEKERLQVAEKNNEKGFSDFEKFSSRCLSTDQVL